MLFTSYHSVFLFFQVKRSHNFYADELPAFQFKVMVWAISLHYFQLQYTHSACVNAYQQNTKGTKASNLYNGLEWDGCLLLTDEHNKRLKNFITQKHTVCQHHMPLSSKHTEEKQNPFHYAVSCQHTITRKIHSCCTFAVSVGHSFLWYWVWVFFQMNIRKHKHSKVETSNLSKPICGTIVNCINWVCLD